MKHKKTPDDRTGDPNRDSPARRQGDDDPNRERRTGTTPRPARRQDGNDDDRTTDSPRRAVIFVPVFVFYRDLLEVLFVGEQV